MPTDDGKTVKAERGKPSQRYWITYIALFLAGLILLGDAFSVAHLTRWTAKVGVALVFSAVALVLGQGRVTGVIATGIIWIAVLLTIFL